MRDGATGAVDEHELEYRIVARSGETRWIEHVCRKVYDRAGAYLGRHAGNRDVTERKRSEEARVELEGQLHLAQKMEALGTLAGGVAHDFNNILGAIVGNVELARQDVGPSHPAVASLDEIRKASRRAKELVQRILAFSRQQPKLQSVITLRPVVEDAVKFLRVSLPAGVELATTFAANTPTVLADPTQIEQVLLNLCTNAWQALEGPAGRIDILWTASRWTTRRRTFLRTSGLAVGRAWQWRIPAPEWTERRSNASSNPSSRPSRPDKAPASAWPLSTGS